MKIIADSLIHLPFPLDFCAIGPNIEPLTCHINGINATLYFPPSLTEGTDGKGIYGEWSWWTGQSLRLILEWDTSHPDDIEEQRQAALAAGDDILRRFLNAYRWRFQRPDVHPVRLDSRTLSLESVDENGQRTELSDPIPSFFFRNLPDEPPMRTSINVETLVQLRSDLNGGLEPPLFDLLQLDADALEAQGETERAALLRDLIEDADR